MTEIKSCSFLKTGLKNKYLETSKKGFGIYPKAFFVYRINPIDIKYFDSFSGTKILNSFLFTIG